MKPSERNAVIIKRGPCGRAFCTLFAWASKHHCFPLGSFARIFKELHEPLTLA